MMSVVGHALACPTPAHAPGFIPQRVPRRFVGQTIVFRGLPYKLFLGRPQKTMVRPTLALTDHPL
jgi:hypothetical protein